MAGMNPFVQGLQGLGNALAPVGNAAQRVDDALMPFAAGPEEAAGTGLMDAGKLLLQHYGPGLEKLVQSSPEFAQHAAQFMQSLGKSTGSATSPRLLTNPEYAQGPGALTQATRGLQKSVLGNFMKNEGKPVIQAMRGNAAKNLAKSSVGAAKEGGRIGAKYVADVGTASAARPKAKPSSKEVAKARQTKPAAKAAASKAKSKTAKKAKKKTAKDKDS